LNRMEPSATETKRALAVVAHKKAAEEHVVDAIALEDGVALQAAREALANIELGEQNRRLENLHASPKSIRATSGGRVSPR
jgi:hypothetical protein